MSVIPKFLITNWSSHAFTKDESNILKYGVKHGLAKEDDIQLMQKIFGNRSAKGKFAKMFLIQNLASNMC